MPKLSTPIVTANTRVGLHYRVSQKTSQP